MSCTRNLFTIAARPSLRTMQNASVRGISSGSRGPVDKPAESSTSPKMPGWRIAAIAGVGVAAFYAMFLAKPDSVAESSIPTTQTKNPAPSRGN
ncbi:hypothetical protein MY11210_003115 [Beauveria gryllotalpidicola]